MMAALLSPVGLRLAGLALLVAAVVGGGLTIAHLRDARDAAEARAAVLDSARASAVATLDTARRQHDRAVTALAELESRQRAAAARSTRLTREVAHAPADGCVGPAVRAVADGLRQP